MERKLKLNRRSFALAASALAGGAALSGAGAVSAQDASPEASPVMDDGNTYEQSPWWPWLSAHIENDTPPDVPGGPIITTATQDEGSAFWVFPGKRKLDPTVFGTEDNPRGTEQPALFLGVPEAMRETGDDGSLQTKVPTPFGDKFAAVDGASVHSKAVDATATDGATTKDEIDFEATFQAPDDQGTYRVVVQKPASHGWAYPTGGGVVTDVILHGVTGWGTRLMPTEFTYSAFWGAGDIYLNDEVVAEGVGVHMMLTEFVRRQPYDLVFDEGVDPNKKHLHLMVLPFNLKGEQQPVSTGFMLPNGMEQPFLHVMFPAVKMERSMG